MKQITFAQAEHQNKKKVTRRERFLAEMNVLVPWQRLLDALSPSYYPDAAGKRGRPPTPLDRMLRIYFLQQWYGLADEALEDAIYDSQAMRDFVGIDLSIESVPDATTLLRFRHLLERHSLTQRIFEEINASLAERGLFMREGTIVDATIIAAPSSTKNQSGKRDPEMSSTRKGKQYYFGMKAHIGVDGDSSLVHSLVGTKAKCHDSTQREVLLHGEEQVIGGDKGYADDRFKQSCRAAGVVYAISDKAKRNHPLSNAQKKRNRQLSSWRAKVEHPFQVIKCQWHFRKVRYKGLKKNTSQLFMLFGLYNLFRVRIKLMAS